MATPLSEDDEPQVTTAVSDLFTLEPNQTVHRADAGIVEHFTLNLLSKSLSTVLKKVP